MRQLVALYLKTANEQSLHVSIINSGSKISESKLENISQPFVRYSNADSDSRQYGGVGLGLAICEAFLKVHNAEYGARNIELELEFYFYLKDLLVEPTLNKTQIRIFIDKYVPILPYFSP